MDRIIGIDISKQDFVVAILTNNKPIIKKFVNNESGFHKLVKYLKMLKIDNAKICMEATGKYGEKLANFFYDLGYKVSVVLILLASKPLLKLICRGIKPTLLMHFSLLIMPTNVIPNYSFLKSQFLRKFKKYIVASKILNLN